jgi:hypothetical protein
MSKSMIRFKTSVLHLFLLLFFSSPSLIAQPDSASLQKLIKESNFCFLSPSFPHAWDSPFEIEERDFQMRINHIEWIDSFEVVNSSHKNLDDIHVKILDNQHLIKTDLNGNVFAILFKKDGRLESVLRNNKPYDLIKYDQNGKLFELGNRSDIKRVSWNENTAEWTNIKSNQTEYTSTYDQMGRLIHIHYPKQHYEYGISGQDVYYDWENDKLLSKTGYGLTKEGAKDPSQIKMTYDPQGLINSINYKGFSSNPPRTLTSSIENLENNQIKISLFEDQHLLQSITFDQYGNWLQMRGQRNYERYIYYRYEKRE